MTLHNDLAHLASNLVTGILLIGLSMGRYGAGLGLLGPWLAGALANLTALFIYGAGYQSLGASGMVLAALGVLTVSGMSEAMRHRPGWKPMLATLSAGLMLFVLTGSNPASDLVVHLGGFVYGLVVGGALELLPAPKRVTWLQPVAMTTGLFSAALAWLLALAR
jgi:membrane associated rhomboid family serine protease